MAVRCKHCGSSRTFTSLAPSWGHAEPGRWHSCRNCGDYFTTKARAVRSTLAKCTGPYAVSAEDPGASRAKHEKADCAVRALAVAACVAYDVAHEALALSGRRPREGTHSSTMFAGARRLVHDARWLSWDVFYAIDRSGRNPTITAFARAYPTGHFLLWSRTHAFALVDGVLYDWHATHGKGLQRVTGGVRLL